jgi:FMN phosphatase YigB (HAD superfamily)
MVTSVESDVLVYKVVLFDFDGVLCHDRFYVGLRDLHPEAWAFIQTQVFGVAGGVADRWMRGELTSHDVNRLVCDSTGLDFTTVSRMLVESVRAMRIETRLLDLARRLAGDGVSVGLVTCNMDVFNQITVQHHRLDEVFSAIVNSCDYGCCKEEQDGRLFDVALQLLGHAGAYGKSLLIDDSPAARQTFIEKGGQAYPYDGYDAFERWADANLLPLMT